MRAVVYHVTGCGAADRIKLGTTSGTAFVHTSADGVVDISHESLIRQWPRLRDWVDEERESRDHYLELVGRARREAALLRDPDLAVALDWRRQARPTPFRTSSS